MIFVLQPFEVEPQRDLFLLPCSYKQLRLFSVRTLEYKVERSLIRLPHPDFLMSTADPKVVRLGPGSAPNFKGPRKVQICRERQDEGRP